MATSALLKVLNIILRKNVLQFYDDRRIHLELSVAILMAVNIVAFSCSKGRNVFKDKKLRQSMSRRGNCWDNAPQESFHGHMKDHIGDNIKGCEEFAEVKEIVDNYMGYYNNSRYQWELAKLSPNEFYQFYTTGIYPLDISNKPVPPKPVKTASELGAEQVETDISNVTQT